MIINRILCLCAVVSATLMSLSFLYMSRILASENLPRSEFTVYAQHATLALDVVAVVLCIVCLFKKRADLMNSILISLNMLLCSLLLAAILTQVAMYLVKI